MLQLDNMIGPRVLTVAAALVVTSVTAQSDLPTVDLGYAVHLATVNVSLILQIVVLPCPNH